MNGAHSSTNSKIEPSSFRYCSSSQYFYPTELNNLHEKRHDSNLLRTRRGLQYDEAIDVLVLFILFVFVFSLSVLKLRWRKAATRFMHEKRYRRRKEVDKKYTSKVDKASFYSP